MVQAYNRRMNAPERTRVADPLVIAGRAYRSRLLVGTGKYRDFDQTREAIVAVRRRDRRRSRSAAPTSARIRTRRRCSTRCRRPSSPYLPNSAGCYTPTTRCAR
jgi:thiazole synthase